MANKFTWTSKHKQKKSSREKRDLFELVGVDLSNQNSLPKKSNCFFHWLERRSSVDLRSPHGRRMIFSFHFFFMRESADFVQHFQKILIKTEEKIVKENVACREWMEVVTNLLLIHNNKAIFFFFLVLKCC